MIFGHMGLDSDSHIAISQLGRLASEIGKVTRERVEEYSNEVALERLVDQEIMTLLTDQEYLMMVWSAGKSEVPFSISAYDLRFMQFGKEFRSNDDLEESMVLVVARPKNGKGRLEAGIYGESIVGNEVRGIGVRYDGQISGFSHVGVHKGFRGDESDVYWRPLISSFDKGLIRNTSFWNLHAGQCGEINKVLIGR